MQENAKQSIDYAADPLLEILSAFILTSNQRVSTLGYVALDSAVKAYNSFPVKLESFSKGSAAFEIAAAEAEYIGATALTLQAFLEAQHWYYSGEIHFFQDEFSEAGAYYQKAVECMSRSLTHFTASTSSEKNAAVLKAIVAYKLFFEIEVLESQAFDAEKGENWNLALSLHEREVALSEQTLTELGEAEMPLKAKLEGHMWYARRGYLECMAHLAAERGDTVLSNRYLDESLYANQMSIQLNPLWREYEQTKREHGI